MLQLSKEDGQAAPVAIRREDYTAPAYWIDSVELTFDLDPAKTRVLNRMNGGDDVYWKSERLARQEASE